MRTTFGNHHDAAAAFAAGQHTGRASNIFFDRGTIFSWGRHFPIARIDPETKTGTFTTRKFSVSTSKHKSIVQSALHRAGYALTFQENP